MSEVDITKRHPQLAASTLTGRTTVTHNTEMSKMFPQWQSKHPRDLISARASDYHWKTSLSRQRLHREDTHSHTRTHTQASSFYAQQLSKNAKNWPFLAQRAECLPLELLLPHRPRKPTGNSRKNAPAEWSGHSLAVICCTKFYGKRKIYGAAFRQFWAVRKDKLRRPVMEGAK